MKLFKRKGKTSRAQALIELALVLPVLVMAIFVIIEISRLFHAWLVVENSARFGVRYAVTGAYNPAHCEGGATEDGKCINPEDETYARVVSIHDVVWAESSSVMRKEEGEVGKTDPGYFNVVVCDPANLVAPVNPFDSYICAPCAAAEDHVGKLAAPLQQTTIGIDKVSNGASAGGSTITISHTTGTGSNRFMIVGISVSNYPSSISISSVKYGTTSLTAVGSRIVAGEGMYMYRLINPASGTANVVVTFNTTPTSGAAAGVITFTGVNQTTPLGTFVSAYDDTNTSGTASVTASTASGELVVDTLTLGMNKTNAVPGADQTQQWNRAGYGSMIRAGGSTQNGSAGGVMSWTFSSSAWYIGAVSIKPATVATSTPTTGATNTPTNTPTNTATNTPTNTATNTATNTPTNTATSTGTNTPTNTATYTPTNTATNTPTNTPTFTPSNTPLPPTATYTPSNTSPPTSTYTPSNTPVPGTATYTPTISPTSTQMPGCQDPCQPGEHVIIVAEFNHPLIMPILNSIWPELRLTSMREAIIETYYVPPAVGTPPDYISPTPRPTNTFGPTRTPASQPTSTPTVIPRCDLVWISNPNANLDQNYIQFEIKAYDWVDWPQELFYNMIIDEVEIWQDEGAAPWEVVGIKWEAWDENGTLYERYDPYGEDWWYLDYIPDPPFLERRCFGAYMCGGVGGYQYNGRMTIYFGQALQGEYGIFPYINFPDYGIRCQKWVPWTSPNWITDTPVEGGTPVDPTASPIPPTQAPPQPTSPPSGPTPYEPPPDD